MRQEWLGQVDGWRRLAADACLTLLRGNAEQAVRRLVGMPIVQMLGVIDDKGMIDLDRVYDAILESIREDIRIDVPGIGAFTCNAEDLAKLKNEIRRANG